MMLAAWGEANSFATEALGHIRTVKAFVSEPLEVAQVRGRNRAALRLGVRDAFGFGATSALAATSTSARACSSCGARGARAARVADGSSAPRALSLRALSLRYGGLLVLEGRNGVSVGSLITFQLYWNMMNSAYQNLQGLITSFTRRPPRPRRSSLLDSLPDIGGGVAPGGGAGGGGADGGGADGGGAPIDWPDFRGGDAPEGAQGRVLLHDEARRTSCSTRSTSRSPAARRARSSGARAAARARSSTCSCASTTCKRRRAARRRARRARARRRRPARAHRASSRRTRSSSRARCARTSRTAPRRARTRDAAVERGRARGAGARLHRGGARARDSPRRAGARIAPLDAASPPRARARARLHRRDEGQVRDARRRARLAALGRPAPARRDRTRLPAQAEHRAARRGDEALDEDSQAAVQAALDGLIGAVAGARGGRAATVVLVAHRLRP